jgi:hypothetical protein
MKTKSAKLVHPQVSARKLAANRKNAQRSTGARSVSGKTKCSMNAIKHGFYAQAVLLKGEDPEAFDTLREEIWSGLSPQNSVEAIYVREIIDMVWRLRRLELVEAAVFDHNSISASGHECGPGFAFTNLAQSDTTFSQLARCEGALSRRLHRALEQLRKIRKEGWKNLPPCLDAGGGGTEPVPEGDASPPTACGSAGAPPATQAASASTSSASAEPPNAPSACSPLPSPINKPADLPMPPIKHTEPPPTQEEMKT